MKSKGGGGGGGSGKLPSRRQKYSKSFFLVFSIRSFGVWRVSDSTVVKYNMLIMHMHVSMQIIHVMHRCISVGKNFPFYS